VSTAAGGLTGQLRWTNRNPNSRVQTVIRGIVPRLAAAFGMLLVVSLVLVRFVSPDRTVHERILDTIQTLTLAGPALQRDALEARVGMLPNYDPLVGDTASLRDAVVELRRVGDATIGGHLNKLAEAIDEQETLLEAFKSDNALLRNSLRYLAFSIGAAAYETGTRQPAVASELSRLAEAMLVFMQDPRADSMQQARAILDRLGGLPVADAFARRGVFSGGGVGDLSWRHVLCHVGESSCTRQAVSFAAVPPRPPRADDRRFDARGYCTASRGSR
jgi:hypothetical protein